MTDKILGRKDNGAGYTRSLYTDSSQRLDNEVDGTLAYTAGDVVKQVSIWQQAEPDGPCDVAIGIYDISAGRANAPLIFSQVVSTDVGTGTELYIDVTGLSGSLSVLAGGETLAIAVASATGTFRSRRVLGSVASLGAAGTTLNDPWVESSTIADEVMDAYMILGTNISVSADASVISGNTLSYSTTGLGTITSATLTDGFSNVLPLTSVTDTSAAVPAIANEQQYCLFGTVTLTVSDGTETATTTLTLTEPAAYIDKEILIANPDTTENGYLFGTNPDNGQANPYEGMQVLADVAINNDGTYEAPSDGTYNFVIIDDFDGWMETYTLTVGEIAKIRQLTSKAFGISRRMRVGL